MGELSASPEAEPSRPDVERGRVVLVPPADFGAFLRHGPSAIRIQGDGVNEWIRCTDRESGWIGKLIMMAPENKKHSCSWRVSAGTRIGVDGTGVYLHEDHMKRYFGIAFELADQTLREQAAPTRRSTPPGAREGQNESELVKLSDKARQQILHSTFKAADANGDGSLGLVELASMIRRVLPQTTQAQVLAMMSAVDTNKDNRIDYAEFIMYLSRRDDGELASKLTEALLTPEAALRAIFRIWDHDGDGVITLAELRRVLRASCMGMSSLQMSELCRYMDTNGDGTICYDEFVDFLFPQPTVRARAAEAEPASR